MGSILSIGLLRKYKKQLLKKVLGVRFDFFLLVFLFLLFSTLYSLLATVRHNHFQSQGNDFAIYDQALWLYSRFETPYSTLTFETDLADRFRPIMIPLSALYWFGDDERVLLIFQAVILSAGVFPVWLVARRKLHWLLALVVAFLYVDFIGIQATAVSDFHEMAILPFFLGWLFYFLEKGWWRSYFVALFLSLAVREHVGLILATISIYIFWVKKKYKIALATAGISLAWSVLAIGQVMPFLGQTYYASFVQKDDTLGKAIFGYLTSPILIFENFFFPFEKVQTLFWSFFSFGLLPLSYLPLLPAIFFQFASRFLDLQHPIRWTLFFHYSAELAPVLAMATIFGSSVILKRYRQLKMLVAVLVVMLVASHVLANVILDSPLKNLANIQFWQEEPWMQDTRFIISQVPKNATVETQNNLIPHLSHRREIYILPIIRDSNYIVLDLHPGQNDWNFYTENLQIATEQFKSLVVGGTYKPIISAGDAYLLKRVIRN